jgi:outer membrane protein assembly factor BamD (BamD/ComL family)
MKIPGYSPLVALSAALALASAVPTPSHAFLGLFKKEGKRAPAAGELASQEQAAQALLQQGISAEAAGDTSKAKRIYSSTTEQYPFTNSGAEAAFREASLERQLGRVQDAFDLLQVFIDQYRASPRFSDAVQLQYELAEEAKGGKKQRSVILLKMRVGTEDVVGMYNQVISNAPFGRFAPLSQFSIGEIYQDAGEKDKSIKAFQKVVDNYPSSKEASEAQYRIGAISNMASKRTQDSSDLTSTRDALASYKASNPDGQRAAEVQTMLAQVDEEEAARSLVTGKFYLKQNKPKAAAIYFSEALKYGSAAAAEEARTLLAELAAENPEAVAETKVTPNTDYTPSGAAGLKGRDDYAGPPAPELAKLTQKPQMRGDAASFSPIPLQEPELPSAPPVSAPTGSLLPATSIPGGREPSLLLPVPPPPAAPPVPPAPEAPAAPAPAAPAPAPEPKQP